MNYDTTLKAVGRISVSGVLAFLFLTLFCFFYYNVPAHEESSDGSSDYKWEANAFYSRGTEGFAWGKTNNDGYLNAFDYSKETPLDILIMGSSHMEGFQVTLKESTAGRLNAMFGRNSAYNIGISGHGFLTCVGNLEAALKKYRPSKYVVMEVGNLSFSEEALIGAINGETKEIASHTGGILGLLQRNQYLRIQMKNYRSRSAGDAVEEDASAIPGVNDERLLDELLAKASRTVKDADADLIIFYHPPTAVNQDGDIFFPDNLALSEQFARCCENNGIRFLDMRERFQSEYESRYVLPHGFSNTTVGAGHLNKYGHNMIAEELYRMIWEET